MATQANPPYDLILMDMQMPVLDGLQATRRIREHEKSSGYHVRIVALTANVLPEDRARCLAAGMDGHLGKPIEPQELQAVLQGGAPAPAPAPAAEPGLSPTVAGAPVFDYQRALDGADATVVRIIAAPFRDNWPGQLRALRASALRGDGAALRHGAHALRGVLGNFGAAPAVALTRRIELLGADGAVEQIDPLLPLLDEALQSLDQALLAWLAQTPA
jgi:CheY-like chemotaxis protein